MALARPIDAHTIFVRQSSSFPARRTNRRDLRRSRYWSLGKRTPRPARTSHGHRSRPFVGARVPPGDRVAAGDWLLPTIGSVWENTPPWTVAAGHAAFRYASLHATRGVHSPKPHERGNRGVPKVSLTPTIAISPRGTKRGIAKGIFSNTFDLRLDSMDITKANVEKNN